MGSKNFIEVFFKFVSIFGTPFFYIPVVIYLSKINSNFTIRLALVLVFVEIICGAIKLVYQKERPIPMQNKTLVQKYISNSFPSIHTARITALSIVLALFFMDILLVFILAILVISVGYSRIYLKKHDFKDVIGGFVIATVISFFVRIW